MYSNTIGPAPVYYEEIACTSEVVDPAGEDFPGKLKLPGGSYLADVFYVAPSDVSAGSLTLGNGMCMPKDIELIDLKLHIACIPEQVACPYILKSPTCCLPRQIISGVASRQGGFCPWGGEGLVRI